jgi:hypothetical protein
VILQGLQISLNMTSILSRRSHMRGFPMVILSWYS